MKTKVTQDRIIKWIESLPTKAQIEKEAGLPQGYLTKCAKGEKNMRPATLEKVVKVIKKYGFKA